MLSAFLRPVLSVFFFAAKIQLAPRPNATKFPMPAGRRENTKNPAMQTPLHTKAASGLVFLNLIALIARVVIAAELHSSKIWGV